MGALLGKFKIYIMAGMAGLVGVLAFAVKILGSRNKKLSSQRDYLKARVHRDHAIMERDNELESQEASHRAEVRNSDRIARDPNKLWGESPDDTGK